MVILYYTRLKSRFMYVCVCVYIYIYMRVVCVCVHTNLPIMTQTAILNTAKYNTNNCGKMRERDRFDTICPSPPPHPIARERK